MYFVRTFHPIGQGAFYTERHQLNDKEFTIVYDCGSATLTKNKLETKIKSTFLKDQVVDVLFISHFHADHINGVEILSQHCDLKNVVIPLVNEEDKILLRALNLVNHNFFDTRLIENPEELFNSNTRIIRIEPVGEINPNANTVIFETSNDIIQISSQIIDSNGSNTDTIDLPSGTVFSIDATRDWFYVPFNYRQIERRMHFITALMDEGLTLSEIDTLNKIIQHKKKIIKAYESINRNLNINSMILYSGRNRDDLVWKLSKTKYPLLNKFYMPPFQIGCLFMGDIDLNEKGLILDIKQRLAQVFLYIGTVQIPHHGSIHNFSPSILSEWMRFAIFSYGTTNTYGHPSDRVIGDVVSNDLHPHFITEYQLSIVIQSS